MLGSICIMLVYIPKSNSIILDIYSSLHPFITPYKRPQSPPDSPFSEKWRAQIRRSERVKDEPLKRGERRVGAGVSFCRPRRTGSQVALNTASLHTSAAEQSRGRTKCPSSLTGICTLLILPRWSGRCLPDERTVFLNVISQMIYEEHSLTIAPATVNK